MIENNRFVLFSVYDIVHPVFVKIMSCEAFVTLATTDGYALGALVLAESIRQVGTERNLVVLISNHLSDFIRLGLKFYRNIYLMKF